MTRRAVALGVALLAGLLGRVATASSALALSVAPWPYPVGGQLPHGLSGTRGSGARAERRRGDPPPLPRGVGRRRGGRRVSRDATRGVCESELRLERMVCRRSARLRHRFIELVGDSRRGTRTQRLPRSFQPDPLFRWDRELLRWTAIRLRQGAAVARSPGPRDGCHVPQHRFRNADVLLAARRTGELQGRRAGVGKRPRPPGLRARPLVAVWNGRVCLGLRPADAHPIRWTHDGRERDALATRLDSGSRHRRPDRRAMERSARIPVQQLRHRPRDVPLAGADLRLRPHPAHASS